MLCLTCQTNLPPSLRPKFAVLRCRRRTAEKDQSIDSRRWDNSAEEGEDSEHEHTCTVCEIKTRFLHVKGLPCRRRDKRSSFVCEVIVIVRQHFTDSCLLILAPSEKVRGIYVRELWTHSNIEALHKRRPFVSSAAWKTLYV